MIKVTKKIIMTITIFNVLIILFCKNDNKLKYTIDNFDNISYHINALRLHNGHEYITNFNYVKICDYFKIQKNGKFYDFEIEDCCNIHNGTFLLDQSKIFVLTKSSTLTGCFQDFNQNSSDSLIEQTKYNDLTRNWNIFFCVAESLHIAQFGNELKISNSKNDTAFLILME